MYTTCNHHPENFQRPEVYALNVWYRCPWACFFLLNLKLWSLIYFCACFLIYHEDVVYGFVLYKKPFWLEG